MSVALGLVLHLSVSAREVGVVSHVRKLAAYATTQAPLAQHLLTSQVPKAF